MKIKSQTITIGIAAYNEERNISSLLTTIISLPIGNAILEKIIVVSDGSKDTTSIKISKIIDKRIELILHTTRKGKAFSLQEICESSNSDILVLLDADVHIKDKNFMSKIVAPIIEKSADLTSVAIDELPVISFIGSMLKTSMELKREIFNFHKNGQNIYTCHGRARALSKKFYKRINFKNYIADDAYTYLFALAHGFIYQFVRTTSIYYSLPENISDHLKQSERFYGSQKQFFKEFGREAVEKAYFIPRLELGLLFLRNLIKNPLQIFSYFLVSGWSLLSSRNYSYRWGTAHSTK